MSLQIGIGAGRRTGLGCAARSLSAGPSFVPCSGGLVSLSAGGPGKMRKFGGPVEKLSKEAYAMALEQQIAARDAQNARRDSPTPAFVEDTKTATPVERIMGIRHGGPMAPTQKESYAAALRDQIESLTAQRAAKEEALKSAAAEGAGAPFGPGGIEASALGARRRHGAPPLPTKESYKLALERQMEMRSNREAAEALQQQQESAACHDDLPDALDEVLCKGRRRGLPPAPLQKSAYAVELQQQIAARKVQEALEAEAKLEETPSSASRFSHQVETVRGRKPAGQAVSRSSLQSALQDQMAERAAKKVANAFHVQAPMAVPVGTEQKGGRRKCDVPTSTKQSYGQALQDQIAERKLQQQNDQSKGGVASAAFIGGCSNDTRPAGGRRHAGGMVPASKDELRADLQRQMAERANKEAAIKFHQRAPARNVAEHGDALDCLVGSHADHASCLPY